MIRRASKLENMGLPTDFDYKNVKGLSLEEVEKLNLIKPITIGQAKRISGVNPSAIQALMIHFKALQKMSQKNKNRQKLQERRLVIQKIKEQNLSDSLTK